MHAQFERYRAMVEAALPLALPKDGGFPVKELPCLPGQDLGTFQFGSTVVLLVGGPRSGAWKPLRAEGTVKVGERLGAFQ